MDKINYYKFRITNAQVKIISLLLIILLGWINKGYSLGRVLEVQTSGDQDVFRLEIQFDRNIDTNKIGLQFQGKTLSLNIPDTEIKKAIPLLESKVNYISSIKTLNSKLNTLNLELEFIGINSSQMKENVSIEGLGKILIVEILPPLWSKKNQIQNSKINSVINDGNFNHSQTAKAQTIENINLSQESALNIENSEKNNELQNKVGETKISTHNEELKEEKNLNKQYPSDETKVPLFTKSEKADKNTSDVTKIIFTVLSILFLGGYSIWYLKRKSKMVNGSESILKIKMLTQFHIGPKKSLAVVRVAGESLLLSITENDIRLIKTLSLLDEDLPDELPENFNDSLSQQNNNGNTTQNQKSNQLNQMDSDKLKMEFDKNANLDEEFSFGPAVKLNFKQKIPILRKII